MRKTMVILLSVCFAIFICSPCGWVLAETEMQAGTLSEITDKNPITVSNTNFELTFDPGNCGIAVKQRSTGIVWKSNPDNPQDDAYATGINKTNLLSQLVISYTNRTSTKQEINNYAASIVRKTYRVYRIDQGVRIDFEFEREGFTIPVCYTIHEDGLNASILFSEIKETTENKLNDMKFLPFFGTASKSDKGYLLVPDGSGALINFNNKKINYPVYEKEVYGHDLTLTVMYETSKQQTIQLPVFGMKKAEGAFLAVIEDGDGQAKIQASVSGITTEYNTINATAAYRMADRIYLLDQLSGNKDVIYNAHDIVASQKFSINYFFLSGEDANYSGMAAVYRSYLEKKGLKAQTDGKAKLFVDLYGGVSKDKSLFGFLYKGREKLTSFDDAEEILKDLKASGVEHITAGYQCYSDDYFKRIAQVSIQPASLLGGKKGLTKLLTYAKENDVALYPYVDFFSFDESGHSFSKYFDINLGLDLGPALINRKDLNTNIKSTKKPGYYLLKPAQYQQAMDAVLKADTKYQTDGLYFGEISNSLASDYDINGWQRDRAINILCEQFQRANEQGRVLLSAPNSYLIPYASEITNLPITSSMNLLFDQDVPFVQMVLKGSVEYSGNPVNIGDTSPKTFLKHIETGSDIKYAFIKEEGTALLRTDLDYLYGANFDNYKEQAVSQYMELKKIADRVQNSKMVSHECNDDIARILYANGTVVYVNYTGSDFQTAEGVTVPSMWYAISKTNERS